MAKPGAQRDRSRARFSGSKKAPCPLLLRDHGVFDQADSDKKEKRRKQWGAREASGGEALHDLIEDGGEFGRISGDYIAVSGVFVAGEG